MIKQSDKDKAKKLGLDIDAIIAAANDPAEKDIVIPDGEILTADQLTLRDVNTKKEGVKEGEKNALPIAIAEINKSTGLKLEVDKIDRFGELGKQLKDHIGKSDDEKVKLLNQQVTDLLTAQTTLTTERDTAKKEVETTKFTYDQFKYLPDNRAKTTNESEYLALLNMRGVEIKQDGVYRNGEPMKDTTTKAPLPHKEAYKQLFEEFKWTAEAPAGAAGGRGGGNSGGGPAGGGKSRSQSEALTKWKEANPGLNEVSPSAMAFVQDQAKDNPTFDWNN